MNNKIPLLCIVGPTASGKTGLSVELAERYNGEIVSCDSMQIYKGMDIATAKVTKEEARGIPEFHGRRCQGKIAFSDFEGAAACRSGLHHSQ